MPEKEEVVLDDPYEVEEIQVVELDQDGGAWQGEEEWYAIKLEPDLNVKVDVYVDGTYLKQLIGGGKIKVRFDKLINHKIEAQLTDNKKIYGYLDIGVTPREEDAKVQIESLTVKESDWDGGAYSGVGELYYVETWPRYEVEVVIDIYVNGDYYMQVWNEQEFNVCFTEVGTHRIEAYWHKNTSISSYLDVEK